MSLFDGQPLPSQPALALPEPWPCMGATPPGEGTDRCTCGHTLDEHRRHAPDAPCTLCPCGLYQRRTIGTPLTGPTPFYSAFQMAVDAAPLSAPTDCVHRWSPIVGSDYERGVVQIAFRCRTCGAVRMPSFREALRYWRIGPLPQDSDEAEARALGEWFEEHKELPR